MPSTGSNLFPSEPPTPAPVPRCWACDDTRVLVFDGGWRPFRPDIDDPADIRNVTIPCERCSPKKGPPA